MTDSESRFESGYEEAQRKLNSHKRYIARLRRKVERREITLQEQDELISSRMLRSQSRREELEEKASRDSLTGLPNRRAFDVEFKGLIEKGKEFGALLIDIDHFKTINDTQGHSSGDQVLEQLGESLRSAVRTESAVDREKDLVIQSSVSRIGGEEFAILLPNVSTSENLFNVAERLRATVESSVFLVKKDGQETRIPVTVSVGGGIFVPGEEPGDFLASVDKLLYVAKDEGRNTRVISMRRSEVPQKAA